jgi:anti-sigma B factor antagonist
VTIIRKVGEAMDLEIEFSKDGNACIVALDGEVDVYTAPALRERLIEASESGCETVVVDMRDVDFIDSSGLGVLVSALKRVREHDGQLRIVTAKEPILKIFRITGLDRVFELSPTLPDDLGSEA